MILKGLGFVAFFAGIKAQNRRNWLGKQRLNFSEKKNIRCMELD
jgi:hypothetical protein